MPKYTVLKTLVLRLDDVEAADENEAEDIAINTDESEMSIHDCQYEAWTDEEEE